MRDNPCNAMPPYPRADITGIVLAGGRARRMGGLDKGLIELCDQPMAAHVVKTLAPQVSEVLVNANRHREDYARATRCRVVADLRGDYAGPLAGMASAMTVASTPFVLTAPCDSPLVSSELGARLYAALRTADAEICVAHDGERLQPVFALLHSSLRASMLAYLDSGERKIDRWYARHRMTRADFSDCVETFCNVNTPSERAQMEAHLSVRH